MLYNVRDIDDPNGENGKKVVKQTDLEPWPEWNDHAYIERKTVTDTETGAEKIEEIPHRVDPIMVEQFFPCYY